MRIPPAAVAAGGILSSKGMEKIGWIPLPVKGAGSDAASARLRHAAGNFLKLGGDVPVIVPPVGKSTAGTVFHTALGIGEISPAVGSQGVERAVAEQTVEIQARRGLDVRHTQAGILTSASSAVPAFPELPPVALWGSAPPIQQRLCAGFSPGFPLSARNGRLRTSRI